MVFLVSRMVLQGSWEGLRAEAATAATEEMEGCSNEIEVVTLLSHISRTPKRQGGCRISLLFYCGCILREERVPWGQHGNAYIWTAMHGHLCICMDMHGHARRCLNPDPAKTCRRNNCTEAKNGNEGMFGERCGLERKNEEMMPLEEKQKSLQETWVLAESRES